MVRTTLLISIQSPVNNVAKIISEESLEVLCL